MASLIRRTVAFLLISIIRSEAFAKSGNAFLGATLRGGVQQQRKSETLSCVMQAPPPSVVSSDAFGEPPRRNGLPVNGVSRQSAAVSVPKKNVRVPVDFVAETKLPTANGQFTLRAYRVPGNPLLEPVVIYSKAHDLSRTSAVRLHDQCVTSEVFGSQRCDCREQLEMALNEIAANGGCVIYLQQEGRGIGLANKVHAYALQDIGFDTVDANLHLGFPEDMREYGVVPSILENLGIESIELLTNNPRKVEILESLGVNVESTRPMVVPQANENNRKYLQTKFDRMEHSNLAPLLQRNGGMAPRRPVHDDADTQEAGVTARSDGYCFGRESVENAIAAVARGEMIIVVDDMDRENEGDFIMAADAVTAMDMAKIVRYSSGVICVSMDSERLEDLKLPSMVEANQDPKETAFTVSVDATKEHGITTGISATDRATTCRLLASQSTKSSDFARPGHIFPLRSKPRGVLERDGHTEAAVDFSRLAGREPVGLLCEIVSEDNPIEMMKLPELKRFAKTHGFVITSIVDLIQYRKDTGL